jgi:hypothetical protein
MRKLESWFNPQAIIAVNRREMTLVQVNLAFFSTEIVQEPKTHEETINSEQKEDQIKWKNAIDKELNEME